MTKFWRRGLVSFVMVLMVFLPVNSVLAAGGYLQSTEMITRGAKLETWLWPTSGGTAKITVIEVDLQDPYLKVDAIYGRDGLTGNKQSIMNMAKEAGAVAAINGDFFTMNLEGAPFGVTIHSGELITSPGHITVINAFALDDSKTPYVGKIDFDGTVFAADGVPYPLYGINKTMYSGGQSHYDRIQMYTSRWNAAKWPGDSLGASYTTVVVKNGVVTQILKNQGPGQIPEDTYVLLAHRRAAEYVDQHIHVGDTIRVDWKLIPDRDYFSAIDGQNVLVQNGQKMPIRYDVNKGNTSRTAVGHSADKRYMYMVTVEKSTSSPGITLEALRDFLVHRGMSDAVNLDGGGSTTMVHRKLGTTQMADAVKPSQGVQRSVPNGFGLFTSAPPGTLKNVELSSLPKGILAGETVPVKIAQAYDEYFNPVTGLSINWDRTDGARISQAGEVYNLTFEEPGDYFLTAGIGHLSKSLAVHVNGKEDIASLTLDKVFLELAPGESVTLKPTITFKDGTRREVSPGMLNWAIEGANGNITPQGVFTAGAASEGTLTVEYDGFETVIPVTIAVPGPEDPEEPEEPEKPAPPKQVKFIIGSREVLVGYSKQEIAKAPQIANGRAYLPLRAYSEILGGYVEWIKGVEKIEIKYKGQKLEFWIGKDYMTVDGVEQKIDAPPFVSEGSTMVPLRAVGESFGMYIDYRKGVQSITVTEKR